MNHTLWSLGLAAALLSAAPAAIAQPAPAGPPPDLTRATQELREAQEEVLLLRLLTALKLSDEQMRRLLPTLQAAQDKLKAQDASDAATMKPHQAALEAARQQVLGGQLGVTRAEQAFQQALQLMQTRRAKMRADLIVSVKATFSRSLTPEQLASAVSVGNEIQMLEMQMRMQATGGEDRGPVAGITRTLDRIRDIPPADWEKAKADFAQRFSGGGREGDRGRGGPGGGGGQEDPRRAKAMQERMQAFGQMSEQVRGMSVQDYQAQRTSIASKMMSSMMRGFGGAQNPEEALTRFVDRYLLSPQMVPAIREKTAPRAASTVR